MKRKLPIVKMCGLTSKFAVDASVKAGADMIGFVFFEPSPRSLKIDLAARLMERVPETIFKVALTVNANDALLDEIAKNTPLDFFQLHGSEKPERLRQIKNRYDIGLIKVLSIAEKSDLLKVQSFEPISDYLMFDSKPPKGANRPGGNALSFDWKILSEFKCSIPWILAGGLNPDNVTHAIRITGAKAVDVSSGIELSPGIKDSKKINAFMRAAKGS